MASPTTSVRAGTTTTTTAINSKNGKYPTLFRAAHLLRNRYEWGIRAMRTIMIAAAALVMVAGSAQARRGGSHSGGGSSHERPVSTVRSSECKSASCFSKHPDGIWTHPITPRKGGGV
jgi:hypothetical protein